ncbi:MAG: glycosyltransferase family 4 protein, partial [Cyanobacteria bacterium J06635_13]
WQSMPELSVTLLGSNATEKVFALESDERVKVTGYIADVTPYFLSHRVFVAPLRYGAGMKGKIGQSLEYGLPIVSTAIGIEGMNLTNAENVLEADRAEEFARAIIRLCQEPNLWQKLADNSDSALSPFSAPSVRQKIQQKFDSLVKVKL